MTCTLPAYRLKINFSIFLCLEIYTMIVASDPWAHGMLWVDPSKNKTTKKSPLANVKWASVESQA